MAGHGTGQVQAVAAGLCAAFASVFAKLAVTSDAVFIMCQGMLSHTHSSTQDDFTDICLPVTLVEYTIVHTFITINQLVSQNFQLRGHISQLVTYCSLLHENPFLYILSTILCK